MRFGRKMQSLFEYECSTLCSIINLCQLYRNCCSPAHYDAYVSICCFFTNSKYFRISVVYLRINLKNKNKKKANVSFFAGSQNSYH